MTSREVIRKAVDKAIENGWAAEELGSTSTWKDLSELERQHVIRLLFTEATVDGYMLIVYKKDFAKALWGEEEIPLEPGKYAILGDRNQIAWRHHLIRMVIAEDPIKYLGKHL